ncbi:hypothetical protein GWI33_007462 [Rhynchophorus ferrugineus]|uniref:Inactive hydroxysteroid dehydrogenase-like protein 1 n=1 Tax=Rhynchophorus ferrugineus TaxID=354439 RepID=A0A834IK87_RHYFE|nr:hypothetical protein GWI33_007462 [Rhynchophorus ferrugineus]
MVDITPIVLLLGSLLAIYYLVEIFWNLLKIIRAYLAPLFLAHEESSLVKKYGSWALVTGSTDGIVSRNLEKLQNTQREIENLYRVKIKLIQADFSLGKKAVDLVKEEVGKLPIGILVNNVGKQYDYPMYLGEVPEEELWDIIKVNVGAVTLMCKAFIEGMALHGRGAIVNVSSGSELQPLPLMTVYAATKTYVKSFTKALQHEYASRGLTIQHLAPMFVATKMNHFSDKIYRKSLFVPDPENYAKYAVSMLGVLDDTTGYWAHGIQTFFTKLPPEAIRTYIGGYMNSLFREEYMQALKR